jgi:hypothetical protein
MDESCGGMLALEVVMPTPRDRKPIDHSSCRLSARSQVTTPRKDPICSKTFSVARSFRKAVSKHLLDNQKTLIMEVNTVVPGKNTVHLDGEVFY